MARKKRQGILPWLSTKINGDDGRFLQVGNSFMLSHKVSALTTGARWLYLCMANESGGRKSFRFPLSSAKKYGISETSLGRWIKELEDGGFIKITLSGRITRQPNEYEFTFTWKERSLP